MRQNQPVTNHNQLASMKFWKLDVIIHLVHRLSSAFWSCLDSTNSKGTRSWSLREKIQIQEICQYNPVERLHAWPQITTGWKMSAMPRWGIEVQCTTWMTPHDNFQKNKLWLHRRSQVKILRFFILQIRKTHGVFRKDGQRFTILKTSKITSWKQNHEKPEEPHVCDGDPASGWVSTQQWLCQLPPFHHLSFCLCHHWRPYYPCYQEFSLWHHG